VKVTAGEVNLGVRRAPQSWAYFYMVLGLILAVALTVISVLEIPGWAKAIAIVCVAIMIVVAVIDSKHIHNWLLRLKSAYEDKVR
jgi:hypothetical protein